MTATTCSGYVESTVATVDEGCTANHNTPARTSCYDPETVVIRAPHIMNIKWAATLVIVAGALAASAAVVLKPERGGSAAPDIAAPAPIDARGVALAKEIGRLHDRQEPGVSPRHGRDLFRFAIAAPRSAPVVLVAAPASGEAAAPPPEPALKLIGVAEDTATGGLIRTAIIAGPGQLYVVKEGDRVTPRYQVARVSPDVVELNDLNDASVRRLALK
jgi:hypothetical protein